MRFYRYARWQSLRQEVSELSDEFSRQRRELEETQEALMKELRLKQLIIGHFVPLEFRRQITPRLHYDEDEEKWIMAPSAELPILPCSWSSRSELRPVSDYEKMARSTEESSSFGRFKVVSSFSVTLHSDSFNRFGLMQCENVILLSLDIPQRTTKDYESPEISPTLQAALTEALQSQSAPVEVQASKYKAVDIHSFLKSACRRKMQLIQRPKSRNSASKRHPQSYTPDGTTLTATPYPKSRGLVPK